MNRWIRRVLVVLEVGGGFAGISILLFSRQWNASVPVTVWTLSSLFALLFFFGIVAGLALMEAPKLGITLSAVYQALQTPAISSPVLTYSAFSGLEVRVGWWQGFLPMAQD